jgi:hypothetical protein
MGHRRPTLSIGLEQAIDDCRILATRQLALPASLRVLPQEPDVDHATRLPAAPPADPS